MIVRSKNTESSSKFENLIDRLRTLLAGRYELARLSRQEINEIARERNLAASEFRALAREPGFPELLQKRLAHAGLSEEALAVSHGDVMRDLQRVCGLCRSKNRCAADLKREERASLPKYCPNEQTLRALIREADRGRSSFLIDGVQSDDAGNVVFLPVAKKALT